MANYTPVQQHIIQALGAGIAHEIQESKKEIPSCKYLTACKRIDRATQLAKAKEKIEAQYAKQD